MKRLKNKILLFISSSLFLIAVQAVNLISNNHAYQEKEPDSLKKYEKY
jgi:cyclic lactone autoinducer peptide